LSGFCREGGNAKAECVRNTAEILSSFEEPNYLFYLLPKNKNHVKAIIRHLPSIKLAEELYKALVELAFDIIGVKHITTNPPPPSKKDHKKIKPFPLAYNSTHIPQAVTKSKYSTH
jgi:hypothetical protein